MTWNNFRMAGWRNAINSGHLKESVMSETGVFIRLHFQARLNSRTFGEPDVKKVSVFVLPYYHLSTPRFLEGQIIECGVQEKQHDCIDYITGTPNCSLRVKCNLPYIF